MKKLTSLSFFLFFIQGAYTQTWTALSVGSAAEVYHMSFPTVDTGYVSLDNGTLRKTTNGALNWSACTMPATGLGPTAFVSGYKGFMVLASGLSQTTDGAQSWTTVINNPALEFFDVYFVNALVGYVSATNIAYDTGFVYKTTNGGANWILLPTVTGPFNIFYPSIYFYSDTVGFFAADGEVLRTGDGGTSWVSVYSDPSFDSWIAMCSPNGQNYFHGGYYANLVTSSNSGNSWNASSSLVYPCYGMYFGTTAHGFYCGGNGLGSGAVEETFNGGLTWTPAYTGNSLWCMDFPSNTVGYAAGTSGVIVKYSGPTNTVENFTELLKVYPNPTAGILNIENCAVNSNLVLVNSTGQIVYTELAKNNLVQIDVSQFAQGVYILEVRSENSISRRKVTVQ